MFGADDFLPCLTWVLLRSDVVTLHLDTDYMMELLDPTQLQGEGKANTVHKHSTRFIYYLARFLGWSNADVSLAASAMSTGGYYLTTLYASLYYISSFRPRLAARQLSVEAQQSLNQWHRRRTLHCNQSRRSKNRRTIRRQPCRDREAQNPETDAGSEGRGSAGGSEASQGRTEGSVEETPEEEEEETRRGRGAEDGSPTSDCNQRDAAGDPTGRRSQAMVEGQQGHG